MHTLINSSSVLNCPLCESTEVMDYASDNIRNYVSCGQCRLVFVPNIFHLSARNEKEIYDQHQNSPDDFGYRIFLSRLLTPLVERLEPNSTGLDFGSGPGPTLSVMLSEKGHEMDIYDPFYAPDTGCFNSSYDFITATEVVEHLSAPGEQLQRLWGLLRPGGWLGVMTKLVIDQASFSNWHYKNDPTHISFFSRDSFTQLADGWGTNAKFFGSDVILLQKPGQG